MLWLYDTGFLFWFAALKTPPAFAGQQKQLERAKVCKIFNIAAFASLCVFVLCCFQLLVSTLPRFAALVMTNGSLKQTLLKRSAGEFSREVFFSPFIDSLNVLYPRSFMA